MTDYMPFGKKKVRHRVLPFKTIPELVLGIRYPKLSNIKSKLKEIKEKYMPKKEKPDLFYIKYYESKSLKEREDILKKSLIYEEYSKTKDNPNKLFYGKILYDYDKLSKLTDIDFYKKIKKRYFVSIDDVKHLCRLLKSPRYGYFTSKNIYNKTSLSQEIEKDIQGEILTTKFKDCSEKMSKEEMILAGKILKHIYNTDIEAFELANYIREEKKKEINKTEYSNPYKSPSKSLSKSPSKSLSKSSSKSLSKSPSKSLSKSPSKSLSKSSSKSLSKSISPYKYRLKKSLNKTQSPEKTTIYLSTKPETMRLPKYDMSMFKYKSKSRSKTRSRSRTRSRSNSTSSYFSAVSNISSKSKSNKI